MGERWSLEPEVRENIESCQQSLASHSRGMEGQTAVRVKTGKGLLRCEGTGAPLGTGLEAIQGILARAMLTACVQGKADRESKGLTRTLLSALSGQ